MNTPQPSKTPRTDDLSKALDEVGNWRPVSKDCLDNAIPWASIHKCYETAKEFVGLKIIHSMLREEAEKRISQLEKELNKARISWGSQQALLKCGDEKIAQLTAELEQLKRANVEMREALIRIRDDAQVECGKQFDSCATVARKALSSITPSTPPTPTIPIDVAQKMYAVLKEHDLWHKMHDELDGYGESELQEHTYSALSLAQEHGLGKPMITPPEAAPRSAANDDRSKVPGCPPECP